MPSSHLPDLVDADAPTLAGYLNWVRRRWWILALAAFLGAAAGLLLTTVQTRAYTSDTRLVLRPVGANAKPTDKVNLDTEAQVVRSLVVAERARKLMGSAVPPDELVEAVTVTVPPNSQVLQVAFEGGTPELARSGSHSFAQAYLDLRLATATRALENETTGLRQQIAEVSKQLGTVAGRLAAAPENSVERERAEADRNVLTNQLAALNTRLSPLLAAPMDPGEIISDARLPTEPSSPNRTLNLATGLGAGILFGIVLALALDRLDTRVRRGRDITDRLGLPMLLELPERSPALAILPPGDRVSRELGRLRNVLLSTVGEPAARGTGRQLLLTDTSAGLAAGFIVGNLAAAYARTGAQVAVVTTRADSPLTAMLGDAPGRYSLADVLRRDVSVLKALTPMPHLTQMRVLLPGSIEPDVELPVAPLLDILSELAARFDHVLIETASPTVAVEAQALASHVDAVIVVAERGRTRSGEIAAALHQFEQVDAAVLGAVLAPRMQPAPATTRRQTPAPRPTLASAVGGAAVPTPPAVKDRKAMLVLPQPTDSTVVLPRVKDGGRDDGAPATGNGMPTTYKSGELNGDAKRRPVALDHIEDAG
ncbi:MAG TPA: lipopolysaccharide biosynthesis protein [Pilimelia sp.]|nr:lipopolysaccharide biosynthesis protein [Pilimelia sp.]